MANNNRLILNDEQAPKLHLKGEKITFANTEGSLGYSTKETEQDVVGLKVQLDTGVESIYITRKLWTKISQSFYIPPKVERVR